MQFMIHISSLNTLHYDLVFVLWDFYVANQAFTDCILYIFFRMEGREAQRKSVLDNNSKLVCLQLAELQRSVQQLTAQNKAKYQQILRHKPAFECRLYKASENQALSKGAARELLLRQLDRLMEEENVLERELSLIKIHCEDAQSQKQSMFNSEITPYEALRSIWQRGGPKSGSAIELIESLNEAVGHIRHSLKRITQIESSSDPETQAEYLKYYAIERCASETCNNCAALQQAKNQLRTRNSKMEEELALLRTKNEEISAELARKEEQLRKLTTKTMERETETQKKLLHLQEKLLATDQQMRQLRKFKEELEANAFFNQEENYQVFVQADCDFSSFSRSTTLSLQSLLDTLVNSQPAEEGNECCLQNDAEAVPPLSLELACNEMMIPELSFGRPEKQGDKVAKKSSLTDRPRTERLKQGVPQKLQSIEELQISTRKYMRSNQLTTKRNNKPAPFAFLDAHCSASTVKLSDSPKNLEGEDPRRAL